MCMFDTYVGNMCTLYPEALSEVCFVCVCVFMCVCLPMCVYDDTVWVLIHILHPLELYMITTVNIKVTTLTFLYFGLELFFQNDQCWHTMSFACTTTGLRVFITQQMWIKLCCCLDDLIPTTSMHIHSHVHPSHILPHIYVHATCPYPCNHHHRLTHTLTHTHWSDWSSLCRCG